MDLCIIFKTFLQILIYCKVESLWKKNSFTGIKVYQDSWTQCVRETKKKWNWQKGKNRSLVCISSLALEYTFFSSIYGTFFRINNMLGHKTSTHKFKKTEFMSSIFSNHTGMKLEFTHRRKTGKFTNTWKLNNKLLNDQWTKKNF